MKSSQIQFVNVLLMSIGFFLLFSAFNTAQNFVTKLFPAIGADSLVVLYSVAPVSTFLSNVVVKPGSERIAMVLAAACYVLFLASFVIGSRPPIHRLVLVASSIVGWGAGVLWVAQGSYLTRNSDSSDDDAGSSRRGRLGGMFWGVFQLCNVVGNLVAALALDESLSHTQLFVIFVGVASSGMLFLCILRKPPPVAKGSELKRPIQSVRQQLRLLGRVLRRRNAWCLMPLMFLSGFELAFATGSFPLLLPSKSIGLVMTAFGVAEVLGGLALGVVIDSIGRRPVLLFGTCVYCATVMLCWVIKFHPAWRSLPFAAAAGLGLGDCTFNLVLFTVIGSAFPANETVGAFVLFQFMQNVGSAVGFGLGSQIRIDRPHDSYSMIIILCTMSIVSLFCYFGAKESFSADQQPLLKANATTKHTNIN